MTNCRNCKREQTESNSFCVYCGAKLSGETAASLETAGAFCSRCGGELIRGHNFCTACGEPSVPSRDQKPRRDSIESIELESKDPLPQKEHGRKGRNRIWALEPLRQSLSSRKFDRTTIVSAIFLVAVLVALLLEIPNRLLQRLDSEGSPNLALTDCASVLEQYHGGIGKKSAANAGGFVAIDWHVDDALYGQVIALDSDEDGIACETDFLRYQDLPCESQRSNFERANAEVGALSKALESVSTKFPELDKVSPENVWATRNEFEAIYQRLEKLPRPYSAFGLEQTSNFVRSYFNNWELLSKAYSGGNQELINDALAELKESQEVLQRTLTVVQGLDSGLLPRC